MEWSDAFAGLAVVLSLVALVLEWRHRVASAGRDARLGELEEERRTEEFRGHWGAYLHVALVEHGNRHYWRIENLGRGGAFGLELSARRAEPDGSYDEEGEHYSATDFHWEWQVPTTLGPGARVYVRALIDDAPDGPWRVMVWWGDRVIRDKHDLDGTATDGVLTVEPFY